MTASARVRLIFNVVCARHVACGILRQIDAVDGCAQSVDDFAESKEMNPMADDVGVFCTAPFLAGVCTLGEHAIIAFHNVVVEFESAGVVVARCEER